MQKPTSFFNKIFLLTFFLTIVISHFSLVKAQTADSLSKKIVINEITLTGNKKTKEKIIFREMVVKTGDTLLVSELMTKMEICRKNIYNLALFNKVVLNVKKWEQDKVDIEIAVDERWFFFPIPKIDIVDRNFNVWWVEQHHDLDRTEYGFRIVYANVLGRADWLRFNFRLGYTRKFELSYSLPYIDKQMRTGIIFFSSYSLNHEVAYTSVLNKQIFFKDEDFLRERKVFGLTVTSRLGIHETTQFELRYNDSKISDTIAKLNPDYFLEGGTKQQYFFFRYQIESDHRDVKLYPLRGDYFSVEISKSGLGKWSDVNMTAMNATYKKYFSVTKKIFLSEQIKGSFSFPKIQPYFNQRAFGFGQDFIRGYEYYVMDGQSYIMWKNTLKYNVLNLLFKDLSFMPKKFNTLPYKFYLKTYFDIGYAVDDYYYNNNSLNNQWLIGTGVGVDLITIYDLLFRWEYSINLRGEKSLYLHFKVDI